MEQILLHCKKREKKNSEKTFWAQSCEAIFLRNQSIWSSNQKEAFLQSWYENFELEQRYPNKKLKALLSKFQVCTKYEEKTKDGKRLVFQQNKDCEKMNKYNLDERPTRIVCNCELCGKPIEPIEVDAEDDDCVVCSKCFEEEKGK